MPRRSNTTQSPTAAHARKRRIATAAGVVPLAIGIASTLLPSGGVPTTSTAAGHVIVQKGVFNPVCTLPFAGVRNASADDHCGMQGGSSDPAKQAESTSKNDFCEATKPPQTLSYQNLIDLQSQSSNIPKSIPDRSVVTALGEGKYISYIAFVKDAHYSDVTAGEAVNCNIAGNDTNDIHIVLVQDSGPNVDECTSTTAEMSPHFRPPSWTPENIMKASAGHPVRVQGHLFYDGSHTPCTAHSRPNPKRASLWEVHPVYSFDVCTQTTIAECQQSTAEWTPLEKLFESESDEANE